MNAPPIPSVSSDKSFIQLQGVTKSYQEGESERTVFQSTHVQIHEGEIVALLGRSGSGKSTLLNLLAGMDLPTSGDVWLQGVPINQLIEKERTLFRRRNIGFVFQFFNLIPTLTVLENLKLPLELNRRHATPDSVQIPNLLEELEIADRAHSFPDRLSGGEQQRVAIARALVHDPALILADEPTGNLDMQTSQTVIKMLGRLIRQTSKTMVVATHSEEVARMGDRILTIENSLLVEQ